jgi:hypothetical protein
MRYALLDPRNSPMGPTPPESTTIVESIVAARYALVNAQIHDYDPPTWLEVFDADAWDGVSYGDLIGQIHIGPRGGARYEGA